MSTVKRMYLGTTLFLSSFLFALPAWADGNTGLGDIPSGLPGGNNTEIRGTIVKVLQTVLSFMALIAVIFIIIAGIRLVVSQGEEEQKEKAKKTIVYVVVGLIVILLAKAIVSFVTTQVLQ